MKIDLRIKEINEKRTPLVYKLNELYMARIEENITEEEYQSRSGYVMMQIKGYRKILNKLYREQYRALCK